MYNPYVTSTISIRCKAPVSYSFKECSYCPIDYRNNTHLISSSQYCSCVCCSASYVYTNVNPRFLCGSRQSSLIHWSASRRIRILPEPDPYYCRVNPVRDPCRKCCCGGGKERGFGERKFTRRVSNGRSFDLENTEMMLSLLIEEVGEECYGVRERDIGSSRRVEIEKKRRESDGFRKQEEKKKRNSDSGILESCLRSKYEAVTIESGKNEAKNRRKEDTMNKDEEILRSENRRGRKSGTSFSSYYTCSSLGEESESESEIHDRNEAFEEELDVGFKTETEKIGNIVYEGEIKENSRKVENVVGSRKRMESDWRKKSEKKLDEVAIEEVLETSHQNFNNFDDNSKYSISDNKGKGRQYSRKSDQVVPGSELIKSQKQFTEISKDQVNVVSNSRKWFSGRDDKSAVAGSLVIGRKSENVKTDNRVSQKDDYKFSNEQVNQVSQIEDINVKRTNISHSRYEDREKRQEDRFSGVSSSVQDTGNQYYIKSEEDSKKMDSRRKFQHSAEISDDRVSRRDDYRSSTEQSNQVDQIQEIDARKTNISQAQYKDNLKRREEQISSSGVSSSVQDTGNKYYIKSEEDSRKMDSRRKFQHSAEISDECVSRRDDFRSSTEQSNQVAQIQEMELGKTNISQAQYEHNVKRREDKSSVISSSVQDTENRYYMKSEEDLRQMDSRGKFSQSAEISDDRVSRRDDYVSSYQQSNQVSQIHDTNIRRTNISNAQYENKVKKREDRSSAISGSIQDTENQYYLQREEELRQINLRRKSQHSTEISAQGQDIQSSRQAIREKESAKGLIDTSIITLGQSSDTQITNIHKTSENKISNQETYSSMVTKSSEESKKITEKSDKRVLRIGSIKETGGTLHKTSSTVSQSQTNNDNLISISDEDVLGSAHRFQKSSSRIVGEFLETVINEASSSHQQIEKSTSEEERLLKSHKNEQKISSEDGDIDFKSKGPSDEIWDEVGPSTREDANTQTQLINSPNKNIIVKRTGRSLWNVISDIVRLPWSAKSKMSTPKSEKRNSPNQSTKSEAWFSSHDRDENSDENIKRNKSISRESIPTPTQTQGEEYSSSSSKDKISPSKTPIESTTPKNGSSSVSTEENFRNDGSIMMETSVSLPSLRIRKSPNVDNVEEFDKRTYQLETEGVSASGSLSGKEQVIVSSSINVKGSEDKVGVDMKRRMLQRTNQVIKDRFDEWEEAFTLETEQRKIDETFMREALLEAKKAGDMWEVPVGAVLVHNGKIIARGYNLVEELRDSTAHAEIICIKEGSNQLRSWRLANTTLYVTLEPCPMCAGAILQARVDTVVWGAPNKLLGADGSWIRLFPGGSDGGTTSEPTDKPPAPVHPFHPKIVIRRGVLGTECADVMQEFFQLRRRKKNLPDTPPTSPSCLPISNHPTKILTRMHDALHFMFCL